jgi:hypothetical protein
VDCSITAAAASSAAAENGNSVAVRRVCRQREAAERSGDERESEQYGEYAPPRGFDLF